MKIQILTTAALVALFATSTASAFNWPAPSGGSELTITNNSGGSIAVGDTLVAGVFIGGGVGAGVLGIAGGRAYAGSVVVKGCDCDRKSTTITNNSGGSIAVGAGTAGSVFVMGD